MTLKDTDRPAYQRIEMDLRQRIGTGQLAAGRMLPSRRNLAREYGVALATVERAIETLLSDGTLRADARRGTFVADSAAAAGRTLAPEGTAIAAAARGNDLRAAARPAGDAAAIGIIATSLPQEPHGEHLAGAESWDAVIIRSLEIALGETGRVSRYVDRSRTPGPWLPLGASVARLLEDGGVDGFVVLGLHDSPGDEMQFVRVMEDAAVPFVYVSVRDSALPSLHVFYDNVSAGRQAAQHLHRSGYNRIVFFAPFHQAWVDERIAGARLGAAAADLPFEVYPETRQADEAGISHTAVAVAAARTAAADGLFAPGTGIIAANDATAVGLLAVAQAAGAQVGNDLGLIGFDNSAEARRSGLTSLSPPLEAMGREAGHLLLRALNGLGLGTHVRLRAHVVPRASTAHLPHASSVATPQES